MQLMNLKRQITYCISLCIPKRKGRWTFGAWMGGRFSDNPKAFLDYMVKSHPEYEYSWVINDPDSIDKRGFENVTFLRRGSFSAWKRVVTSEYLIMSHGSRDFGKYNWNGGAKKIYFDHGTPYKLYGLDSFRKRREGFVEKLRYIIKMWAVKLEHHADYYVASSDVFKEIIERTLCTGKATIIHAGLPRNEILYDSQKRIELRKRILSRLGFDDTVKIILYLPTFRDSGKRCFSFFDDAEKWDSILENAIIIEKNHFADKFSGDIVRSNRIFKGNEFDTQDLIAISDMSITDYSSCFFDFLITDKPVLLFPYDYKDYSEIERGVYFSIDELDCGHVAYDDLSLFDMIRDFVINSWPLSEKQIRVKRKYITYESAENSKVIYEAISNKSN